MRWDAHIQADSALFGFMSAHNNPSYKQYAAYRCANQVIVPTGPTHHYVVKCKHEVMHLAFSILETEKIVPKLRRFSCALLKGIIMIRLRPAHRQINDSKTKTKSTQTKIINFKPSEIAIFNLKVY
jgi:hypothetical protein